MSRKVIIGVDPGADGAVVVFKDGVFLEKHTVPKKTVKSTKAAKEKSTGKNKKDSKGKLIYNDKKVMDEIQHNLVFKDLKQRYPDACVFIEKVKNIMSVGAVQNFNFGHNFGLVRGFIIANGFDDFHEYTPQVWQKPIVLLCDYVYTSSGKDTKQSSLKAFKRLFPNEDMRATPRSTIFHDGLVDAALIAKFADTIHNKTDDDYFDGL